MDNHIDFYKLQLVVVSICLAISSIAVAHIFVHSNNVTNKKNCIFTKMQLQIYFDVLYSRHKSLQHCNSCKIPRKYTGVIKKLYIILWPGFKCHKILPYLELLYKLKGCILVSLLFVVIHEPLCDTCYSCEVSKFTFFFWR